MHDKPTVNVIYNGEKLKDFLLKSGMGQECLFQGVDIVVQWKQLQLGTMRLWVQSLASLSGLRIWRCCELWCRSKTRLRFGVAVAVASLAATALI